MYALTKDIMKKIDLDTQLKIKSYDLMEEAGTKMANIILKNYEPHNVLLALGSGGNAGDALVVGRIFLNNKINVDAYIVDEIKNNDALINLNKFSGNIINNIDFNKYELIIDGLFGIGLSRNLNDKYIDIINKINESNIKIISLDIPSGIDASFGISYNAFIKSDLCISVEYHKTGLFLNDGLDSYKKLALIKVGMDKPNDKIKIIEKNDFKNMFPNRLRNTNKGSYHKASIIAGSKKYPGASKISYNSLLAFKMGVGFLNLYVPKSLYDIYALNNPEIIVNEIKEIDGHIDFDKDKLDEIIKRSDSIAIGMGMQVSKELYDTISYLLNNYDKRLLIDADGLNTLSKYGIDILNNKKCEVILTPHLKEFERLSGLNIDEIKNNIFEISKNFAKKYNITLVLKSSSTIITDGKNISIQANGSTGLAKAGSGDALSGIITGLLAYLCNENTYKIASLGSYILGLSSNLIAKKEPEECITISEIIKYIPKTIKYIKS